MVENLTKRKIDKAEIKKEIIFLCKSEIEKKIELHTKAMHDAQETANKYKGAMESRYDTFKEEAQQRRDSHARQIDISIKQKSVLMNLKNQLKTKVEFGSVIETENTLYFICFFITEDNLTVHDKELITLREDTPLGLLLKDKKVGETISFNSQTINILDLY